ncbi:MAG: transposase [Dokdonella sp.]
MPRLPRIDVPGLPQHIVQRGVDRQPCFFSDDDRRRYLADLREIALTLDCSIHAYVLMTNHVHLLATSKEFGDLGRMMQALGRRYVRYVNDLHGRTGTLWEGRFKACLVDPDRYVLACQRYIELNPVRAAMVFDPGDYPWSSYRHHVLGAPDALLRTHAAYDALGSDQAARCEAYRQVVARALADEDVAAIRLYLQRQQALGTERFQQQVSAMLGRRAGPGRSGRPPKLRETVL